MRNCWEIAKKQLRNGWETVEKRLRTNKQNEKWLCLGKTDLVKTKQKLLQSNKVERDKWVINVTISHNVTVYFQVFLNK